MKSLYPFRTEPPYCSLARFYRRKRKKSTARSSRSRNNLSSTCRQVLASLYRPLFGVPPGIPVTFMWDSPAPPRESNEVLAIERKYNSSLQQVACV